MVEYDQLHPAEFDELVAQAPVAYQPIGCMEYHGKHLPFGLDGLKAFALCKRVAGAAGGVVLPPIHFGIHGVGNMRLSVWRDHNLYISEELFGQLLGETCDQLAAVGFKVIVLWTGHHPAYQGVFIKEFAQRFMWQRHSRVMVVVPDENEAASAMGLERVDHAGPWETSLMMELYPDSVKMERLDDDLRGVSIDPRGTSSRELGTRACAWFVAQVEGQVREALRTIAAYERDEEEGRS